MINQVFLTVNNIQKRISACDTYALKRQVCQMVRDGKKKFREMATAKLDGAILSYDYDYEKWCIGDRVGITPYANFDVALEEFVKLAMEEREVIQ